MFTGHTFCSHNEVDCVGIAAVKSWSGWLITHKIIILIKRYYILRTHYLIIWLCTALNTMYESLILFADFRETSVSLYRCGVPDGVRWPTLCTQHFFFSSFCSVWIRDNNCNKTKSWIHIASPPWKRAANLFAEKSSNESPSNIKHRRLSGGVLLNLRAEKENKGKRIICGWLKKAYSTLALWVDDSQRSSSIQANFEKERERMERKKDSLPHFRPDLPRRLIRWNMQRFQEGRKHRGLKSSPCLRSGVVPWSTTQPPVTSTSFPLKGTLLEASSEGFKITSNTAATDMNSNAHSHAHSVSPVAPNVADVCLLKAVLLRLGTGAPWKHWALSIGAKRHWGRPLRDTSLRFIQLTFTAHRSTNHTCTLWREA